MSQHANADAVSLTPQTSHRWLIEGSLSFANACAALSQGRALLAEHAAVDIDFTPMTRCDSAGLAVLIEWAGHAVRHNVQLRYLHLPQQVQALAAMSEVDVLLPIDFVG